MNNNIGTRIKFYRTQSGITQRDLADILGYKGHSSIARIEDGTNDVPCSVLEKMANIFGISPAAFFNPCPAEFEEYLPYLQKADATTLSNIRAILHMPEKRESSNSTVKANA